MPRDVPVGNGHLLIAFDKDYRIRDFYYPHVGEENHAQNDQFRIGVWVDGVFSWVPEGWSLSKGYLDDALVTDVVLLNQILQLRLLIHDFVDFHQNIFLRKIAVENLASRPREVRVFLTQDFHILGDSIGDTAAFRPDVKALVHYKRDRYFLVNVLVDGKSGVDHFATGNKEHRDLQGTWKDAEDGELSGNPIAQGSVDSVVGINLSVAGKGQETCFYWIAVGKSWDEALELNTAVIKRSPDTFLKRTKDYWELWSDKERLNEELLPPKIIRLYRKSLLITRTQIDNCGSIIAANDSDVVYFNRDTYSYMWPRDAALVSHALDLAGYPEISRRFFELCGRIIEKDGYLLHKYTPSGLPASSWHPWQKDKRAQLPIQEDETALVIWALWEHFKIYKDIEFIRDLYRPLIKAAADFMMNYRDSKTRLPLPSYDLWEERQGVLTFTVATVYGGLSAAANFMEAFGDTELAAAYRQGALDLREAMDEHLFLKKEKRFARMINFNKNGTVEIDATVDASLYGVFAFGAYPVDDPRVKSTMDQVYDKLWCLTRVGGLARYENDPYYRRSSDVPGNPWFVTTLWLAQYYIALAVTRDELDKALPIMEWVCDRALPSGVLAEQVDPHTNEPISVSPLTWSHASFIATVQQYLNKLVEIEKCPQCSQPKYSKKL
jgi:oligosaccharide amylase